MVESSADRSLVGDRPIVAIVILNWNGSAHTLDCVRSVMKLDHDQFRVVVCDNASRPEDVSALRELDKYSGGQFMEFGSVHDAIQSTGMPKVSLIHTGSNLGYAGGVNVGLRFAMTRDYIQYFWVLNNDTEVTPTSLTCLLDRARLDDNIGICGATLILHGKRNEVQCFAGASCSPKNGSSRAIGFGASTSDTPTDSRDVESRLAYVNGACMLVSRAFVERVGLMDESYFLYSEEHDWAERGLRAGFRLGYAPGSIVYHRHGATIGTSASGGSDLSLFYLFRNKLAFTRKFFPQHYSRVAIKLLIDALKFSARGHWRKTKSAMRGLLAEPSMRKY